MNTKHPLLLCSIFAITAISGCNATREVSETDDTPTENIVPVKSGNDLEFRADQPAQTANQQISRQLAEQDAIVRLSESAEQAKSPTAAIAGTSNLPAGSESLAYKRSVAQLSEKSLSDLRVAREPLDRENYDSFNDNPIHLVAEHPVSTFSVDVDTASYSNVRRLLNQGQLPQNSAVRVEELINYFSYQYPIPESADSPFSLYTEMGPSPWHADRQLLHIGIQGYQPPAESLPAANLVFLIDVSGSMRSPDKLELLKSSLKLLVRQLDQQDRLSIAVYAGAAGTVLEPTPGAEQAKILSAIDQLTAGGSTNGGAGIHLAYALAQQNLQADGINRVILATDGDFNVGTTSQQALKDLIAEKRNSGIALTVLGFGSGNYNDALMQELSQIGNGNAAYIDTLNEARKVLVDELAQTLNIIAKDVKIQVEFNPAVVAEYRLIGYETRHLEREDFNNDAVDAGDIGAGHTVTALYELALTDSAGTLIDPLRYQTSSQSQPVAEQELGFLKLRYKRPQGNTSALISSPLLRQDIVPTLAATSSNYQFSAAVAAFGQLLRGGDYLNGFSFQQVLALASRARGSDSYGYRGEFLSMLRTAEVLATPVLSSPTSLADDSVASNR
jgi:Ca-activated chloride channel family protein